MSQHILISVSSDMSLNLSSFNKKKNQLGDQIGERVPYFASICLIIQYHVIKFASICLIIQYHVIFDRIFPMRYQHPTKLQVPKYLS